MPPISQRISAYRMHFTHISFNHHNLVKMAESKEAITWGHVFLTDAQNKLRCSTEAHQYRSKLRWPDA